MSFHISFRFFCTVRYWKWPSCSGFPGSNCDFPVRKVSNPLDCWIPNFWFFHGDFLSPRQGCGQHHYLVSLWPSWRTSQALESQRHRPFSHPRGLVSTIDLARNRPDFDDFPSKPPLKSNETQRNHRKIFMKNHRKPNNYVNSTKNRAFYDADLW